MKLIGHRGAAGLALENTAASIAAAKAAGVDAIEIDVRLTRDNVLVVCHDQTLRRIAGDGRKIISSTAKELSQLKLKNGERLLTVNQALQLAKPKPLIIEAKADGWAIPLAKALNSYKPSQAIVIGRNHEELATFHSLAPRFKTYLVQRFNPADVFQALHDAHKYRFTGIILNYWLLNPLTYRLAKRHKLRVGVYTVNQVWIACYLHWLFPDVFIITNRPDRMQDLRQKAHSS